MTECVSDYAGWYYWRIVNGGFTQYRPPKRNSSASALRQLLPFKMPLTDQK
jgi:hypothetical protein